ncbi:MAG: hypothetical protein SF029_15190 [bacterium]|nr:hypothetical protein [bacterium]
MLIDLLFLHQNPVYRAEWLYLRRWRERRYAARWLILPPLIPIFFIAYLPVAVYITDVTVGLLGVMAAVIIPIHLLVMLRTLALAIHVARRESSGHAWDTLVLTGVSARQIVVGKWWAVTRAMLPEYLLTALLTMGLAYGLAQYLHADNFLCIIVYFPDGLCYTSYRMSYGGFPPWEFLPYIPALWKFASAFGFLLMMNLLSAALMTAIGQAAARLTSRQPKSVPYSISIGIFVSLLIIVLTASWMTDKVIRETDKAWCVNWAFSCPTIRREFTPSEAEIRIVAADKLWVIEILQFGLLTFIGNGALLAANTLRPPFWEGLRLLLRNLISFGIGVSLHLILIYGALRLAQIAAVRHNALSPKHERVRLIRL